MVYGIFVLDIMDISASSPSPPHRLAATLPPQQTQSGAPKLQDSNRRSFLPIIMSLHQHADSQIYCDFSVYMSFFS